MIRTITRSIAALVLAASPAAAQDLTHSAPPQDHPVVIRGATVHTASGDPIANGVVAFNNGRLSFVGTAEQARILAMTPDTEVIDATGMRVYPGLIASNTQLGLTEISAVRAMRDFNEVGSVTPEVRAAVSVNPDSTLIPVARSNGVLTFGSFPTGGRVPGRASVMRSDGWTWEDMAIDTAAGLVINWPSVRAGDAWWEKPDKDPAETIQKNLDAIDELFDAASAYLKLRASDSTHPTDLRFEAMRPGMAGEEPVFIGANDLDQITSAVTWAIARGLKPVILGARDAHLCADLLVAHDVPVILEGTHGFPKRADSAYDESFARPAALREAGVRFALNVSDRGGNERNLPYEAGRAVAYGLDHEDALRAITLWPARILGVDSEIGSLETGKAATLILTTGDVLEVTSDTARAWIDGRDIDLTNKQTELRDKYRAKYKQLDIIED